VNVFQMYVENGNKAGFYVVRNSWRNTYALVLSVGGQKEGPLPGKPPYHSGADGKNPAVLALMYSVWNADPLGPPEPLRSPGTYAYTMLEGRPPTKRWESR
jgi:hypothetical protein